ncbi:MAG: hypothetical protein IT317_03585 [Anaerolineales bacterium]|nr:hypothetical protein [Anaerolineales bacterium]
MRGRTLLIWVLGLAFAVTLAVVVGQRLSAQAMAIVIGIIAGVAASIPTSLLVVWATARLSLPRAGYAVPRPAPRERPIVVMQAPPAPAYSPPSGYAPNGEAGAPGVSAGGGYAPAGYAQAGYGPLPPRRFTVVGGGRVLDADEIEAQEEDEAWMP